MSKPATTLIRIAAVGAGLAAAVGLYFVQNGKLPPVLQAPAPAVKPAAAPSATQAKQQAMAALMALPELKAWSAKLEKDSGGRMHGAVVEYDPSTRLVDGKPYYQLSFVENGAAAAHSWESFLVAVDGSTILVDDVTTDKLLTLEQWRATRHPMQRTSADAND